LSALRHLELKYLYDAMEVQGSMVKPLLCLSALTALEVNVQNAFFTAEAWGLLGSLTNLSKLSIKHVSLNFLQPGLDNLSGLTNLTMLALYGSSRHLCDMAYFDSTDSKGSSTTNPLAFLWHMPKLARLRICGFPSLFTHLDGILRSTTQCSKLTHASFLGPLIAEAGTISTGSVLNQMQSLCWMELGLDATYARSIQPETLAGLSLLTDLKTLRLVGSRSATRYKALQVQVPRAEVLILDKCCDQTFALV